MPRVFKKTSTQYTKMLPREDGSGKVWLEVQAHGDLTALTPYKVIINEFGWITAALASDNKTYIVGVPRAAISSGDIGWVQIGGYCKDMTTASHTLSTGHGLEIHSGATVDLGADYSGVDAEFAVAAETTTVAATTHDVMLVPRQIIGST